MKMINSRADSQQKKVRIGQLPSLQPIQKQSSVGGGNKINLAQFDSNKPVKIISSATDSGQTSTTSLKDKNISIKGIPIPKSTKAGPIKAS
jgi:hypothetical protein